jgi:hypothetical protein
VALEHGAHGAVEDEDATGKLLLKRFGNWATVVASIHGAVDGWFPAEALRSFRFQGRERPDRNRNCALSQFKVAHTTQRSPK